MTAAHARGHQPWRVARGNITACPACASAEIEEMSATRGIPTNSCLLLASREEAAAYPTGDLTLMFCRACGFCFNADFDSDLSEYSARYEETQGYSPRFVDFARDLAARWVDRHDLAGKTVLEIGCGSMGEFLQFMVEAGAGRGIGIDPALNVERIEAPDPERFEWIPDFYSDQYAHLAADAIVCRHTLEHISPVGEFMTMLRRTIGDRKGTKVLFELPDVLRVLEEAAFWDVYYEHCSYFSLGSLARLFRRSGFEVTDLALEYDQQYVVIEAVPSTVPAAGEPLAVEDDLEKLSKAVVHYRTTVDNLLAHWRERLDAEAARGGRSVIWGAGSKGVSFLTNVASAAIEYAVDINPTKHGMYMAGTGQQIVSPGFLQQYQPTLVVVMNPIYLAEIGAELRGLGVHAELVAV